MRPILVLGCALLIPTRTMVADLPICTGGAYEPVDPRHLQADGRILLVPFGDFPAESAHRLAEHFRAKYGIDIQARHPLALPEHSRVAERGQVDSTVLLETLAEQYPETPTRTVVIGLTTADIFIPGLEWRYAFSNRRAPRLAVVSPARMDRGCMGDPARASGHADGATAKDGWEEHRPAVLRAAAQQATRQHVVYMDRRTAGAGHHGRGFLTGSAPSLFKELAALTRAGFRDDERKG